MNCPYCNQEMEHGYVTSGREVFFSKEAGGFFHGMGGDIRLTKKNYTFPQTEAYCCKQCHFIIIPYDEKQVR